MAQHASRRTREFVAQRWTPDGAPSFAWPGGYPIGYLTDDGEYLCARCVNDWTNPVHLDGDGDGWRIEGYHVFEGTAEDYDGGVYCAHCWSALVENTDWLAVDHGA